MKKYALLVGIEQYGSGITRLQYACRDVYGIGRALSQACCFDQVRILADQEDRDYGQSRIDLPTDLNILNALEEASVRLEESDLFLFLFAGHGIERMEDKVQRGYLLAQNAAPKFGRGLIGIAELKGLLSNLACRQRLILLDCCRNDPEAGRSQSDNLMSPLLSRELVEASTRPAKKSQATILMMACRSGQRAYEWDEERHGAFSYYLKQGLEKEGWKGGQLEGRDLCAYVETQVGMWAGKKKLKQTPEFQQLESAQAVVLADRLTPSEEPARPSEKPPREVARKPGVGWTMPAFLAGCILVVGVLAWYWAHPAKRDQANTQENENQKAEQSRNTLPLPTNFTPSVPLSTQSQSSLSPSDFQSPIQAESLSNTIPVVVSPPARSNAPPASGRLRLKTDAFANIRTISRETSRTNDLGTADAEGYWGSYAMKPGTYDFELSKTHHETHLIRDVEIPPGIEVSLQWDLVPDPGEVQVSSAPSGATVVLDGQSLTNTPAVLRPVSAETPHRLYVRKSGYLASPVETFTLSPAEVKTLDFRILTPETGSLKLEVVSSRGMHLPEHEVFWKDQQLIPSNDVISLPVLEDELSLRIQARDHLATNLVIRLRPNEFRQERIVLHPSRPAEADQAASFVLVPVIRQFPSHPAETDSAASHRLPKATPTEIKTAARQIGNLLVTVDSLQLVPNPYPSQSKFSSDRDGFARLTLIFSNMSPSEILSVALEEGTEGPLMLHNQRGDIFHILVYNPTFDFMTLKNDLRGIATVVEADDQYRGKMTEIPPRESIQVSAHCVTRWGNKAGDFRPYRLQTTIILGKPISSFPSVLKRHEIAIIIE